MTNRSHNIAMVGGENLEKASFFSINPIQDTVISKYLYFKAKLLKIFRKK